MMEKDLRARADEVRETSGAVRRLLNVMDQLLSVLEDPADPGELAELCGYAEAVLLRAHQLETQVLSLDLFAATEVPA